MRRWERLWQQKKRAGLDCSHVPNGNRLSRKGPDAAVVLGSKALLTVSVQSTEKTADTADS
ncbi:MAG: hypothetical protein AB8A32_08105 [Prochlorococcus sp.]